MPRWDLGTVGYVVGSPSDIDNAFAELYLRCYPTMNDMTREMSSKVSCIITSIRRGLPVSSAVFLLDPYGIANEVGTRYGIKRDIILNWVYSWFINYLRGDGFITDTDVVFLDQELSALSHMMKASIGGGASAIASIMATIIMVKRINASELPIRVIDVRDRATKYVEALATNH